LLQNGLKKYGKCMEFMKYEKLVLRAVARKDSRSPKERGQKIFSKA